MGIVALGMAACATTGASQEVLLAQRVAPSDAPVSKQKQFELISVADELKIDEAGTLAAAAKGTGYDECLTALSCSYCRKYDGWWMQRGCTRE